MATDNLDGTFAPMQIYLTCYEVLEKQKNGRGQEILITAYQQLHEHAGQIEEEALRKLFFNHVAVHEVVVGGYGDLGGSEFWQRPAEPGGGDTR